jgi:hypothetical protein
MKAGARYGRPGPLRKMVARTSAASLLHGSAVTNVWGATGSLGGESEGGAHRSVGEADRPPALNVLGESAELHSSGGYTHSPSPRMRKPSTKIRLRTLSANSPRSCGSRSRIFELKCSTKGRGNVSVGGCTNSRHSLTRAE